MPNQSKRKISSPSSLRMDRQKNMKRVKALRDSGKLKRDNPLSKLHNSIKGALGSLSRKTDSSATRKIEGPKTKRLSSPTAQQAANKLIKTGQGKSKPKLKTFTSSDLIGTEGMSASEIIKRGPQGEPKRRPNESMTAYRQRLAKYRRENK